MAVISVRIPDSEYKYAVQFAKFKGIKLSAYLRDLLEQKIEDFEDERLAKQLEENMKKHPEDYEKVYTHEEFWKEVLN